MGIFDIFQRGRIGDPSLEVRTMSEALLPPSRNDTPVIGISDALGLSMVYRAINIHAISAKQMSIDVYRSGVTIESPSFVRQPDFRITRAAWIEQSIVSLATTGNAYWEIARDQTGRVMNLQVLNPLDVTINSKDDGTVESYKVASSAKEKSLRPEQVQHLSLLRVPGTNYGLGPIQAAKRELKGAIDTRDYSSNWFEESGIPSGVLKSDQVLAPDQATAAKNAWNATAGAKNGVAVLGQGLSYAPIFLSPSDAQFIESQNFNVTQVARLFGVPSSLMLADAGGSSMTYQNVEQDWIGYIRFSLMSYLIEIEQGLTSLLPRGQEAHFNIEALLRSDTLTRYNAHKLGIEAGFLTIEEVRAIEGLGGIA
jgi:HK97 family phage portal protein